MVDINNLLRKMNESDVNVPVSLYDSIMQGVEAVRVKKSRRFIRFSFLQMQLKYAVTAVVILLVGFLYFYSSRLPISIIEKQGYINIADDKGEWQKLKDGEKVTKDDLIQTGDKSEILLKFGKYLTVELIDENRIKIEKMKKILWREKYQFYLVRGREIYTVAKDGIKLKVLTDDLILRNTGTKFEINAEDKCTYVKVLKGRVLIKKRIGNIEKIENFKYKNKMYKKLLKSILGTEAIISKGETAFVSKKDNKKIEALINRIIKERKTFDGNALLKFEKYIPIKREKKPGTGWDYDIGSPVWASPVLYKGNLYFGTENGTVISLSEKGRCIWKMKIGESFFTKGLIFQNKLYIIDSKGILFAINIANRQVEWKKKVGEIMYSAPVEEYGTVFIANTAGEIMALNPVKGDIIWKKKLGSGVFCEPVIKNGKIYLGCEDGTIYSINCYNSDIIWKIDTGIRIAVSSPKIYNNILYIANNKGVTYYIDCKKGKILGKEEVKRKILSSPIIKQNDLFIASYDGMLYSIDIGRKVNWKLKLDENIESSFKIFNNNIILPVKKGKIYIIDSRNGSILKIINLQGDIVSTPVIKGKKVYITTLGGRIYSVSLSEDLVL